jgi:hypothetical protein
MFIYVEGELRVFFTHFQTFLEKRLQKKKQNHQHEQDEAEKEGI